MRQINICAVEPNRIISQSEITSGEFMRSLASPFIAVFALGSAVACSPAAEQAKYAPADPVKVHDPKLYKMGDKVHGSNFAVEVTKAYSAERIGPATATLEPQRGNALIVIEYNVSNTGPLPYHGHDVPRVSLRVGPDGYYGLSAAPRFFFSEEELKQNRYTEEFKPGETRREVEIVDFPLRFRTAGAFVAETEEGRRIELPQDILSHPLPGRPSTVLAARARRQ